MTRCTYSLTFPDGSKYVGSAENFAHRKRMHMRQFDAGAGVNARVAEKWRQFGACQFDVIEEIAVGDDLLQAERLAFDFLKPELNLRRPVPRELVLTIDGDERSLANWCHEFDVAAPTVRSRLARGWSAKQALGIDPAPSAQLAEKAAALQDAAEERALSRRIAYQGITSSLRKHCLRLGIPYQRAYYRWRRGAALDEVFGE
jgi:hypothetical protein